MRKLLATTAVLTAFGLAACGDDSDETTSASEAAEEEASVTPQAAIDEIDAVRAGLDDALSSYEDGDAQAAEEAASDAYLEHFELVEVPLEEADEELNEELETQIREELRAEIDDGAPVADVRQLVAEIDRGLDRATAALEKAA